MKITITIPRKEVYTLTKKEAVNINMNVGGIRGGSGVPTEPFPVGSVFTSVVNTNPAELLGYGTWESFANGRVLIGHDADDPDFNTDEKTGGAKTVQSSPQSFQGDQLTNHQHAGISAGTPSGTVGAADRNVTVSGGMTTIVADRTHGHGFTGNNLPSHQHAGQSAGTPSGTNTPGIATSVVQPYIVVYFWKRTA